MRALKSNRRSERRDEKGNLLNSVISSTTSKAYGSARRPSRRDTFLGSADSLLLAAHEEVEAGRLDLAMENAYRAALRIAGAVCAESEAVRKRKRLPSSAWDKLALTGADGEEWAARFKKYSSVRARVASGIEPHPDSKMVFELLAAVEEFYFYAHPSYASLAA